MKTELLALIENYGKALVHQTEGKISAFKDAKNLMSNIVFLLDKAEQAPSAKCETCNDNGLIGGPSFYDPGEGGVPCPDCSAPAAVEPVAYLHDDGYWTAAKTEQGRALSDRLHFAGSPKIGVHLHPAPTTKAEPADALDAKRLDFVERSRVALVPEFEGPWEALVYKDDAEPVVAGEGNTPRAAIDAAIAAQAAQHGGTKL